MRSNTPRRWAALLALLFSLGLGAGACGDRTNEELGNSGDWEGPSPGVTEGTNPAIQTDRQQSTPEEAEQGSDTGP